MSKLSELIAQIDEWKQEYHVNKGGDLVFQNKRLLSNVRFTAKSLHEIQKHSRGFEMLPDTIQNPDEVWSRWQDKEQTSVIRNYIKDNYVVITLDGVVTDAFIFSKGNIYKLRKGLIL